MWTTPPVSDRAPDGTAYEVTGDGPLVVLIHGLGLARAMWDDMLPAFVGFRVLRYDLHGHGDSLPRAQAVTLSDYAAQVIGLMDHLGETRAHLVGFSIGGMINRRVALDHPGRVASLAILNSPHDRGPEAQAAVEARAIAARDQGAFATFDAAVQRWFTPDHIASGAGPALVRLWREQVDDGSYARTSSVLARGVPELTGRAGEITVPSLVMTCENDVGSTPAMSRAIAGEIPGARFRVVPGLKHLGILERPEVFRAEVAGFLGTC